MLPVFEIGHNIESQYMCKTIVLQGLRCGVNNILFNILHIYMHILKQSYYMFNTLKIVSLIYFVVSEINT